MSLGARGNLKDTKKKLVRGPCHADILCWYEEPEGDNSVVEITKLITLICSVTLII